MAPIWGIRPQVGVDAVVPAFLIIVLGGVIDHFVSQARKQTAINGAAERLTAERRGGRMNWRTKNSPPGCAP